MQNGGGDLNGSVRISREATPRSSREVGKGNHVSSDKQIFDGHTQGGSVALVARNKEVWRRRSSCHDERSQKIWKKKEKKKEEAIHEVSVEEIFRNILNDLKSGDKELKHVERKERGWSIVESSTRLDYWVIGPLPQIKIMGLSVFKKEKPSPLFIVDNWVQRPITITEQGYGGLGEYKDMSYVLSVLGGPKREGGIQNCSNGFGTYGAKEKSELTKMGLVSTAQMNRFHKSVVRSWTEYQFQHHAENQCVLGDGELEDNEEENIVREKMLLKTYFRRHDNHHFSSSQRLCNESTLCEDLWGDEFAQAGVELEEANMDSLSGSSDDEGAVLDQEEEEVEEILPNLASLWEPDEGNKVISSGMEQNREEKYDRVGGSSAKYSQESGCKVNYDWKDIDQTMEVMGMALIKAKEEQLLKIQKKHMRELKKLSFNVKFGSSNKRESRVIK